LWVIADSHRTARTQTVHHHQEQQAVVPPTDPRPRRGKDRPAGVRRRRPFARPSTSLGGVDAVGRRASCPMRKAMVPTGPGNRITRTRDDGGRVWRARTRSVPHPPCSRADERDSELRLPRTRTTATQVWGGKDKKLVPRSGGRGGDYSRSPPWTRQPGYPVPHAFRLTGLRY
jgi:hypothetical protein